MSFFEGVIIAESLEDPAILSRVEITSTAVQDVTEAHETPWLDRWTLHQVRVASEDAAGLARDLSRCLDRSHAGSWYADFYDATHHYVIFRDRVLFIDRRNRA